MVEAAAEALDDVGVGLPVRVACALVAIGRADGGQIGRDLEPRLGQHDVLHRHRRLDVLGPETQMSDEAGRGVADLVRSRLLVLVPPAPELPATAGGFDYQWTPRIR